MGFLVFWLICGFVGGMILSNKERSAIGGFLLGFLLGPIGILIAIFSKSEDDKQKDEALEKGESEEYKKCPFCAEAIKKDAVKCRYCGSDLEDEAVASES